MNSIDRIAVLDMDSIAYAISSPSKVQDGQGNYIKDPETGKYIFVDKTEADIRFNCKYLIDKILTDCLADSYIGFIKNNNTGAHRYIAKSDYKANRSKERPNWWKFTSNYLVENYNIHLVDNYEVDDVVNIYRLTRPGAFMVAIDKDLLGLPGTHYNWSNGNWYHNTQEEAIINFWKDMIAGQHGDGIKGIPGKGKVFVDKLFLDRKIDELEELVIDTYKKYFNDSWEEEFNKNKICLTILTEPNEYPIDLSLNPIKFNRMGYEIK